MKVKRIGYTPTESKEILEIPADFEPEIILLYDNYPNNAFLETGEIDFEGNTNMPLYIRDTGLTMAYSPYSTNGGSLKYYASNFASYEDGVATIDFSETYKKLYENHKYTIILVGAIEEEIL